MSEVRESQPSLLALKMEGGTSSEGINECWGPLGTGKDKKTDSILTPPQRIQPC